MIAWRPGVAAMISADVLIILSDIEGLYTANPQLDPNAEFVPLVENTIPPAVEAMAGENLSGESRGGMVTKVAAAKIAMGAGCATIIALGKTDNPIGRIVNGARHTQFLPSGNPRTARKDWIAGSLKPSGILVLDAGAVKALGNGKSLLPAGVARVEGTFEKGDALAIKNPDGREIARGLSAYSSDDARTIAGHKTSEIETLLGYRGRDEMVHRDDLVLL